MFFLIPNEQTNLAMKINLVRLGIDDEKSIQLYNWNTRKCVELIAEGNNIHTMRDSSSLKKGDRYNFIVNGKWIWDLQNEEIEINKEGLQIKSIYVDDKITLNTEDYLIPSKSPEISVRGDELYSQFNNFIDDLEVLSKLETLRRKMLNFIKYLKNEKDHR